MEPLGTDFGDLLARGALVLLAGCGLWSLAVLATVLAEAVTAGRVRWSRLTGCPPALRVWLLGLAMAATGLLAPAQAGDASGLPREELALDGLALPDRQAGRPRTAPPGTRVLVVRDGDCLWSLARALLPAASDARVSRAVAAFHVRNRAVIGPDPDLLRPGQRLVVPPGLPHPSVPAPQEAP